MIFRMKKLLLVFLLLLSNSFTNAQTVVWVLKPSSYNSIELINKNLYKVTRNDKIGLIHSDGTVVAEPIYDNLSDFYEDKALLTVNDGYGECVSGCLSSDGSYYPYAEKFYTLQGQKFFSDGLLSVRDAKEKVGYIDVSGNKVLGFDGKYDRIKPFTEGYAAVYKGKKYYLIDKEGEKTIFMLDDVGEIAGGTNPCNGMVYLWDSSKKHFYTLDLKRKGAKCVQLFMKPSDTSFDYLSRFAFVSKASKEIPFRKLTYKGELGKSPVQKDGLYGFYDNEKIVLPCQLNSATQFEDGYSIVIINGEIGILKYIAGDGFEITNSEDCVRFIDKKEVTCNFFLNIPFVWSDKDLRISVKDENGVAYETDNDSELYSFNVKPSASGRNTYSVEIYSEGLKLYEKELEYEFLRICPICSGDYNRCHGQHSDDKEKKRKEEPKCEYCGKLLKDCPKDGKH